MRDDAPRPDDPPSGARLPVRPPHVSGQVDPLRSYAMAQRNVLEMIPREAFTDWSVTGTWPARFHMIMEPGAIRRVVQTRVEDYPKSDIARAMLAGSSVCSYTGSNRRATWTRSAASPSVATRKRSRAACTW